MACRGYWRSRRIQANRRLRREGWQRRRETERERERAERETTRVKETEGQEKPVYLGEGNPRVLEGATVHPIITNRQIWIDFQIPGMLLRLALELPEVDEVIAVLTQAREDLLEAISEDA